MARKMRDSGVEWIGEVPEGWEVNLIGTFYSQRSEKVSDTDYAPLSVTMKGVLPQLATVAKTDDGDNRKLVKKGDFAINSRSDRRGSCGISEYDGSVSLINTILMPRGEMDPRYYNWLFHTEAFADEFYKWGHGIVDDLWTTRWSEMKRIQIVAPPLPEQRRIADYLDEKCAAIDGAVDELKRGIEDCKAWKKAIIEETVFSGLRHKESVETGDDWLTSIPSSWGFEQIRYLFALRDERNDKLLSEVNLISLYTDQGVVQHCDLEKTTGNKASTADGYKIVKENDIVVNIILCWMGAIGRSVYNGVTSPAYDVYQPIDESRVLSRYYHYLFRTSRFNGKCYQEGRGIMMMRWRTYSSEFRAIKVPVPPMKEQQAIADYLDEKCAAIDALVAEKEKLIADLEAYKKSLIFELVTGKREVA